MPARASGWPAAGVPARAPRQSGGWRMLGVAARLGLALSCSCTPPPRQATIAGGALQGVRVRVGESASGTEVRLRAGDILEVSLAETRTTGYRWEVVSDGAPACRAEGEDFAAPPRPPGAPGLHTWMFRAAQAGNASLEMAYRRPFGSGDPARRFTLRVAVE